MRNRPRALPGPATRDPIFVRERSMLVSAAFLWLVFAGDPGFAERLDAEFVERHRTLLEGAEYDLARGAFEEGLSAAQEALALAEQRGDRLRLASARLVRANLSIAIGDSRAAIQDLEVVIAEAVALGIQELALAARLNLANARSALGESAAAIGLYAEVEANARAANRIELVIRAQINGLRVRVDNGESVTETRWRAVRETIDRLPPSVDKATALTHLGESHLRALARLDADADPQPETRAHTQAGSEALTAALEVLDLASGAASGAESGAADPRIEGAAPRVRAQALGHLAGFYAARDRLDEALDLTRRALRQAQRSGFEADLFAWHRQAAELSARLSRRDAAIDQYETTLRVLEANRTAISRRRLLSMSRLEEAADLSNLYRTYVDLLLRRAADAETEVERRRDLLTAQATLEHLKSDELRDYFEDDCVIRYRDRLTSVATVSYDAVVVYPFLLEDRLELLVSVGDELIQVVVDVGRATLTEEVVRFRQLIEKRTTRQYLRPARRLDAWLVAPIQPILDRFEPRTLVFVPDGILRTIPMAALHDGERFLIERYALGLTPGLELTDPKPLGPENRRALVAGVSEGVQGFEPLPNVEREVDSVHDLLGGDKIINQSFSRDALTRKIREKHFGIVHIASHAEFNATAAGGFLLAHDGRLSFDALADAVETADYRDHPLELVILSACETADGNDRAALGLSGVAVKAGARSALGTLWSVSDQTTADFMIRFYETLQSPGTSRAEAVRAAQVHLLEIPSYRHPYYWSPFLLINSWL